MRIIKRSIRDNEMEATYKEIKVESEDFSAEVKKDILADYGLEPSMWDELIEDSEPLGELSLTINETENTFFFSDDTNLIYFEYIKVED